ncbi:MAG TPA: hypothetical protein VJC11_03530 [Patescibacteria group bacterium]|nr:hypothetical protein [Patescibacteria group bacterium]
MKHFLQIVRIRAMIYSLVALGFMAVAHSAFAISLENPIGTDDPRVFIGRMIRGILGLSGAVALLFFIYGGFLYLVAQGEQERIQRGKQTIVWATLGLVVIFGSYAFLNYLFTGLLAIQ